MKKATNNTSSILTSEAIDLLSRTCQNPNTRATVIQDPKGFLAKNGIEIDESVELRLYEHVPTPRRDTESNEQIFETQFRRFAMTEELPPGIVEIWPGSHMGCPFPTYPYKTTKKETVCDVWVIAASGREWIPDSEGSPYGHFEYTNFHEVCIVSHEVEVEVIECLSRIILTRNQP